MYLELGQLLYRDKKKLKQETKSEVKVKMIKYCMPNKRNVRKDDLI